ncbi:hypothetical protein K435DRAFT_764708 [Dendrothele bispora CBS 962.96]|uniref:F-box domain-containing protein n=1 Tax=Dendrothele bispora (strain CBS 962.96) TaxID=1314807 RepID=A0A4S8L8N4_DENBC|nr:hypothetical protein K435DRAFT_764708 [Dendrothele bispora CBS 962.96]
MVDIGTLHIPVELLERIFDEISDKQDLKALRCINSNFCSLLDPRLFSRIKIDLEEYDSPNFRVLASNSSRIAPHVHKLDLCSSELKYPTDDKGWMKKLLLVNRIRKEQKESRAYILKALGSFKNLRILNFPYWSDPFPDLWRVLERKEIHLQRITNTFNIDQAFLEYLASYSGLEHLWIRSISPTTTASTANYFLTKALPKHSGSLQSLSIHPGEEGTQWSFGKDSAEMFSHCLQLRSLVIWVDAVDIHAANSEEDVVTICLDLAQKLPHLSTLAISPAYANRKRSPRPRRILDGRPYWVGHQNTINERITSRVLAYKLPSVRAGNPKVIVNGQIYAIQNVDEVSSAYLPTVRLH